MAPNRLHTPIPLYLNAARIISYFLSATCSALCLLGQTATDFRSLVPFAVTGLVQGQNTVIFVVGNGGDSPNPTGLRIDGISSTCPGAFNTGVDASGAALPDGAVDPHYTLIESADAKAVGPSA